MLVSAATRSKRPFRGSASHLRRLLNALGEPGARSWNQWRKANPSVRPDLRGLDRSMLGPAANRLAELDLSGAHLSEARLSGLHAWQLRLQGADLRHATLDECDLSFANLRRANFESCRLVRANLSLASAQGASFRHANLSHAVLNGASLQGADLSGARVAGLSTWGVQLDATTRQRALVLEDLGDFLEDLVDTEDAGAKSRIGEVDHIEAIYLIYLLKDRDKFKTVIDALTDKVVLILGNFSARRIAVLRDVERALTRLGYAPIIFDFDEPADRDLIETVGLIAGLSCFVVADLTQPKSTPLETMLVVPQLRVPFAPIIEKGGRPFALLQSLQAKYEWVLPTWTYPSRQSLCREFKARVVHPCEAMRQRIRAQRRALAGRSRKQGERRA